MSGADHQPLSKLARLFAPTLQSELRRVVPLVARELGLDPDPILNQLGRNPATARFVAELLQVQARETKRGRPVWSERQERMATKVEELRAKGVSEPALAAAAQDELFREGLVSSRSGKRISRKQITRNDRRVRSLRAP